MSRPKIAPNQVNASGTSNGQVLTSNGTDAAWQTPAAPAHQSTHAPGGTDALPWTTINGRGTTAAKPAAAASNAGYLYFDTGLGKLQRSTGTAWEDVSEVGGVTSVSGTGTVSGLSLTGTVTSTGSLTLGGTLAVTPANFASQTANTVLAAPNGSAGAPTFRAIVAADVPTLNQNTTGTAANVTGTVAVANGGTGATTAPTARTNLGATTVGGNLFTLTNPSAVTFPRINADNTVSALSAASFLTAIGASSSADVQTFASSGTWTKPSGAKAVEIICIGAGGGGGSGRRGSLTFSLGGTGGAGGAVARNVFAASVLGATETVTVGAGGSGGTSITTAATNGNAGADGGSSTFGNWLFAGGGGGGPGGNATSAVGSIGGSVARTGTFTSTTPVGGQGAAKVDGQTANGTSAEYGGAAGGNSRSGGNGLSGGSAIFGGPGGGSGGAVDGSGLGGGSGGNAASYTFGGGVGGGGGGASGNNGGAGAAPSLSLCGTGGGGGGGGDTTTGGSGGAGGRGAGGGGGGASVSGNSGAGGAGGNGAVIVISYF